MLTARGRSVDRRVGRSTGCRPTDAVAGYLEALEAGALHRARTLSGRDRAPAADPVASLPPAEARELRRLEHAFVAYARTYAAAHGIEYATWREFCPPRCSAVPASGRTAEPRRAGVSGRRAMRLDLHLDEVFAAGVDDVWRALTEPAVLARWLMDNDFDARAGRRFTLTGPPTTDWGGRIECTVVDIDPPRRMAWSWNGGTPHEVDTRVVFEVRPGTSDGHTTRLQLRHTGDAMPAQRHALRAMWSRRLDCLGVVLAPGYARRLRIDAPRARVFDAVATAEGIVGWWAPMSRADGDGGMRLQLTGHDELVGAGVDAVRRPSWVRWSCTTHVGERVWDGTVVTFELVDLGAAGCEIRVRHEGVPGRAVERGWDRVLGLLAASPGPDDAS